MSMTKDSRAFDEFMEQARRDDDLSHDAYLSEQYFMNRRKGNLSNCDPGDEQVTPPKGTTPKTK
jgi:hypothetical protein